MKDYLLNQLIKEENKKSLTSYLDNWEYNDRIENRKNKRLTSKVFREPYQRKVFLKLFAKMRKKIRQGNQFDIATELKKNFLQAKADGLFESVYFYDYPFIRDSLTGAYVEKSLEQLQNEKDEFNKLEEIQSLKRNFFLNSIGLDPYYYYYEIFNDRVFIDYFSVASAAAIVQMKKRLSKRKG